MMTRSQRGFSLTELLVSMAIIMSLMSLTVAGLRPSKGGGDGDIRLAARQLASALLASQSRSVKGAKETAVIVIPDADFGRQAWESTAVYGGQRYPLIEGTVQSWTSTSDPNVANVQLVPANAMPEDLAHGYRVLFFLRQSDGTEGPPSSWFSFSSTGTSEVTGSGEVRLRRENGQTPESAIWPTMPNVSSGQSLGFRLARYPSPIDVFQHVLPEDVIIDLRYSGYGDETMANWGTLADRGAIGIGFDKVGAVDSLMQKVLPGPTPSRTVQPIAPCESLYFFVTSRTFSADSGAVPLANPKAMWVVLNPRNGRVTISKNKPQARDDTAALRAAREYARKGITIGS